MLSSPASRKRSSRALSSEHPRPAGKRQQRNSPYVSQGNAACSICQDQAVHLVQLGACCHAICRGCMTSHLLHALKLSQLPLRCPMPHCRARLTVQPAVQLLEQQVPGSKALAAKALLAGPDPLALLPEDSCFACPYLDCQVPLELDVQLPDCPSDCPACSRPVCGTCRSKWHSGLRCAQYQALAGSRAAGRNSSSITVQQQQQQPLISAHDSSNWQQHMLGYTMGAAQQQHQVQKVLEIHPLPQISVATAGKSFGQQLCEQQQSIPTEASEQDSMAWSPLKPGSGA